MKISLTLLLLFFSFNLYSQQDYTFGVLTQKEKEMIRYEKDTTANALVLYSEGKTEFFEKQGYIFIKTLVYRKIKIFSKEAANHATIQINLFNNKNRRESINSIRGITHNNDKISRLKKENIYTTKLSEKNSKVVFTLPNIKNGSIIEYSYTVESPFTFNLTGWNFQATIPTLESVFRAKIPKNYVYNRSLIGHQKLEKKEAFIKKRCFRIRGISGSADCKVLLYSMKDVPAFIEEDFMTSKKNYLSRIVFEQSEVNRLDGTKKKYTKTWESVDKEFREDNEIGGQLKKKKFFKNRLPLEIYNEAGQLKKAKKIYQFIQNHYSWNKKYRIFSEIDVIKSFNEKVGNISEINISLINSLNASNIEAQLVLLSTRENGFPIKLHPVMTDFNYVIAKVIINGKSYFLDATDKSLPFGILPFKCLNRDARIMDFENGSYWEDIIPIKNSEEKIEANLEIDDGGNIIRNISVTYKGYNAIDKRKHFENITEEKYLNDIEDRNDFLKIVNYKNFNLNKKDEDFKEEYKIIVENEASNAKRILISPFFMGKIDDNPFKLNNRIYPVDFGYPKTFKYAFSITIPENYSIESLPQNKLLKLPNEKGHLFYKVEKLKNIINLNFEYSLSNPHFRNFEYNRLKTFFKHIINSQNEPILLIKN